MRRFYKAATATGDGRILLDGKPVRTPSRADLAAPTPELAAAIAAEWDAQGETIDPRTMPMTGLANAAIDRIAPDTDAYARGLAVFGESDLLCYRAEGPAKLAARQAERWDPILAWARRRYDVDFVIAPGIVHRRQPRDTVDQLTQAVLARDAFALAGLSPLVTVGGSLIVALALAEGAIDLDTAWEAAMLDELWQIEQWGDDEEAVRALAARRHDFEAGYRFLTLL
ncbi:MAG: ATP12 family chaperone protein [Sphingosinicella sp.]|uniref:ATP12 family chaperone protein n=1 Tax=Sphingosinicella sp. TaxID=1917971 RepID=UPI0040378FBC